MKKYYIFQFVLVLFAGLVLFAVLAGYDMTPSKKTIYVVSMTANEMSGAL